MIHPFKDYEAVQASTHDARPLTLVAAVAVEDWEGVAATTATTVQATTTGVSIRMSPADKR